MSTRTGGLRRATAGLTALALLATQVALPPRAEASHLGSSTASAGSAPPPAITATLTSGTFSALVPMTLGVNTVTANAQDGAGNTNSKTSQVFLARPPVNHP